MLLQYETPEEFAAHLAERAANPDLSYAGTPEQAETMWRSQTDAVNSFGRYLAAHPEARLAVYVVWEQCAGRKTPHRAEVPPSYFGGSGFERLPRRPPAQYRAGICRWREPAGGNPPRAARTNGSAANRTVVSQPLDNGGNRAWRQWTSCRAAPECSI